MNLMRRKNIYILIDFIIIARGNVFEESWSSFLPFGIPSKPKQAGGGG